MNIDTFREEKKILEAPGRPIEDTFNHFVFKERSSRNFLLIAVLGTILQFIILKILYPFPDFISDSHSYIATNTYNMRVNLWPVGYSKFIAFVHYISPSDTLLLALQYSIVQISLAYFFFSIVYLYKPAGATRKALFLFLLFNPLVLYLSNCVLSDTLFASLTLLFITQFLWMFRKPSIHQVLVQGIIIGLAFTIRYTAVYYPVLAIIGLMLSQHSKVVKIWGGLLGAALMLPYIISTRQATKEVTGTAEFSVFGGWQIANNALYMYQHITVDSNNLPFATRALDRTSKKFFAEIPPSKEDLAALPGTYFIKVPWAILKPYLDNRYSYNDPPGQFKAWGKVSPVYNEYGKYLITHHPFPFIGYYLWPNTKNYFLPHLEKFGDYNLGITTVPAYVQDWFNYITPDVYAISTNYQAGLFNIFRILFMALNVYFIGYLIWFIRAGGFKTISSFQRKSIQFIIAYMVINFAFSVLATPIVLRYQVVPLIALFSFCVLLTGFPAKNTRSSFNAR